MPSREFKILRQANSFIEGCCLDEVTAYVGDLSADVLTDAYVEYTVGGNTPQHFQTKWLIRTEDGQETIIQGDRGVVLSAADAAKLTAMGFTVAGTETYDNLTDMTVPTGTVPTIKVWVSPDCCNFIKVYFGPIDNV